MTEPTAQYIGGRIASIRRETMTQREFAKRTGFTVSVVQRIEQTGHVSATELVKISRVLGKNPGWFVRPLTKFVSRTQKWDVDEHDGGPVIEDSTNPGMSRSNE